MCYFCKSMNKKILALLICIILFNIQSLFGQPQGPPNAPCWPPPCIPIDGGISIFTFLSILFGYKFLSNKK